MLNYKIPAAIFLTFFACWIAIALSQAFYSVAPFHYDSAYYLLRAVQIHDLVVGHGRWHAFLEILHHDKDFLDLALRALLAPYFLSTLHGHMVVVAWFMFLFNGLCIHYVQRRTHSIALSLLVPAAVFGCPFLYLPYQGIADYWKESVAIWLLGSALFSLLLSEGFHRMKWSFCCSIFLGLLVMQRTGLAIYAALMFFPIVLLNLFWLFQRGPFQDAVLKASAFILPASVLCGLVAYVQWQVLYEYYFLKGYDYASHRQVVLNILVSLHKGPWLFAPLIGFMAMGLIFSVVVANWEKQYRDVMIALWMMAGFVLANVLCKALYSSFFNCLWALSIVLLGALAPIERRRSIGKTITASVLFAVWIGMCAVDFCLAHAGANAIAKASSAYRTFYDALTDLLLTQPAPRPFSFLESEDYARFYAHVVFNRKLPLQAFSISGFTSSHDSYYRLEFKNQANAIGLLAGHILRAIEYPNMFVVSYCDPKEAQSSPAYGPDGAHIAVPIAAAEATYLKNNKQWAVLKKINSPYGCVYAYRYGASLDAPSRAQKVVKAWP